MTDPAFVAAAYAVVLGGLIVYATSIERRTRTARAAAEAVGRERELDLARKPPEPAPTMSAEGAEAP